MNSVIWTFVGSMVGCIMGSIIGNVLYVHIFRRQMDVMLKDARLKLQLLEAQIKPNLQDTAEPVKHNG